MNLLVVTTLSASESVTPVDNLKLQVRRCEADGVKVDLMIDPDQSGLDAWLRANRPDRFYCTTRRSYPPGEDPFPVIAFLESRGLESLTSPWSALSIAEDKSKVLEATGMGCPAIFIPSGFPESRASIPEQLGRALIVKPNNLSGSVGIDRDCVVDGAEAALRKARMLMNSHPQMNGVRIERYSEHSREFAIGGIQMAAGEWDFSAYELYSLSSERHEIFDARQKSLPPAMRQFGRRAAGAHVRAALEKMARQCIDALNIRGCFRLDVVEQNGQLFVIDVNLLPVLTQSLSWEWAACDGYDEADNLLRLLKGGGRPACGPESLASARCSVDADEHSGGVV